MKKINNTSWSILIGVLVAIMVFAAGFGGYVYGYTTAIRNAELISVTESGYEIAFGNQIHIYG